MNGKNSIFQEDSIKTKYSTEVISIENKNLADFEIEFDLKRQDLIIEKEKLAEKNKKMCLMNEELYKVKKNEEINIFDLNYHVH